MMGHSDQWPTGCSDEVHVTLMGIVSKVHSYSVHPGEIRSERQHF